MPSLATLATFAHALGMVLTPGPHMMYLVSRGLTQGRMAGALSALAVPMPLDRRPA